MDTFEDGSDLSCDESQATRLMQNALDDRMDSTRKTSDLHRSTHRDDPNVSKDISIDSLPSSSRNPGSGPRYHFYGLATTQTQTQHEEEPNAGSQKENMHAPMPFGDTRTAANSSNPRPVSPHASNSRNTTRAPRGEPLSHSPSGATSKKPKSANTKAVAFQPPCATTTSSIPHINTTAPHAPPPRPTTYPSTRTNTRIRRESSQDSFAEPLSQDPEQQFLAATTQFDIPLSELERSSLPTEERAHTTSAERSTMFSFSSAQTRGIARTPESPQGRILVAATPSHSGSSQSGSQPSQSLSDAFGQSQLFHGQPVDTSYDDALDDQDIQSQQSTQAYDSTAPTSSYSRYVNGEPDPDVATQVVVDYEPTQPSTQANNPDDYNDVAGYDDRGGSTAWGTSSTGIGQQFPAGRAPSSNTSGPRNLLSLVDHNKAWKLQHYQEQAAIGQMNARGTRTPSTIPEEPLLQETQPSHDENLPGPSRGFAARVLRRPSPPPARIAGDILRRVEQAGTDIMDVVPDSEPLRHEPATSTRVGQGASRSTTTSPMKRAFRQISPGSDPNPNSGEIVPDSMIMDDEGGTEDKEASGIDDAVDEDDEEDDIPLAAATLKRGRKADVDGIGSKGKGNAVSKTSVMAPPPAIPQHKQPARSSKGKGKDPAPLLASAKGKQKQATTAQSDADTTIRETRKSRAAAHAQSKKEQGPSWDTGEVPSSVPDQDVAKPPSKPSSRARPKAPSAVKGSRSTAAALRTRSTSTTSTVTKRRRLASYDDDDDPLTESDDDLLIPKAEKEDGTEPADDDYMDADFQDDAPTAGPASRKRKRGTKAAGSKPSKASSRTSSRANKTALVTPATRQTKRLRSVVSASTSVGPATRVFALWKQDGHYYSGIVHSLQPHSRYLVKFDDDTEGTVTLDQLRQCELKIGDDVIVADKSRNAKVVDISKQGPEDIVGVKVDEEYLEVGMHDIRIASKTIIYAWKDRKLAPESIIAVVKPLKPSPSPSKLSVQRTASLKGIQSRVLAKTGLVVTLSVGNENWEKDKDQVTIAIRNNGGTVIDDWSSIIRMDGKHSRSNKRWSVHKEEVEWTGQEGIERVFLLADDANLKPKYLTALALGIPCISMNWLHDSIDAGEEKDWMGYLLPQGFSEPLNARVSQFVDLDWGNSIHHLSDIMANLIPPKIFASMSILCLSEDFVPLPKSKRIQANEEKAKEASRTVPRIILSMGAKQVEAVHELKFASEAPSTFDYVVIKDVDNYVDELDGCTTVDLPWVKHCLIAGRRLPLPDWSQPAPRSQ